MNRPSWFARLWMRLFPHCLPDPPPPPDLPPPVDPPADLPRAKQMHAEADRDLAEAARRAAEVQRAMSQLRTHSSDDEFTHLAEVTFGRRR